MTIVASDLKFFASERMTDDLSTVPGVGGGGYISATEVIDGVTNNVFPDVMPGDVLTGKTQLRQVYPIVLSANDDAMSNAVAGLTVRPTDSAVEVIAFTAPGASAAEAATAVGTQWKGVGGTIFSDGVLVSAFSPTRPGIPWGVYFAAGVPAGIAVGGLVMLQAYGGFSSLRVVTALDATAVGLDGSVPWVAGPNPVQLRSFDGLFSGTRVSAVSHLAASAAAAATALSVDKMWARVQLPGASSVNDSSEPSARRGQLPLYLPGDVLLIENGSTREAAVVDSVNYLTGDITLTAGLAHSYASGSKVTRPVGLGMLQAAANNVFAQQTWTRTWANVAIGVGIASRYSGVIAVTNDGGATDRWACVFKDATHYNLISERLGQIGAGATTADYSPLNPATSQPYFTLLASGWGSGWLPGNVLRFNTKAASAPIWLQRLIEPGATVGASQVGLFLRGDVDA